MPTAKRRLYITLEPEDEFVFDKLNDLTGMSRASWAKKVIKDAMPALGNLATALERSKDSQLSAVAVFDDVFQRAIFDDSQMDIEDSISNQKKLRKTASTKALKPKTTRKKRS